ncbi:MAG: MarR family transcriptional regulator [Anaerolineaceae bacterium]|nr:MarR family transcriptional regulator [Anaerolineaceae bacterium]
MKKTASTLEEMNLGRATEAYFTMMSAGRRIKHRLMVRKSFGDLTPTQFFTMLHLWHGGPQPQGKLCEQINRSPGNLTLVIDNLEKNHWVERKRDSNDRRVVVIALTETGLAKVIETDKIHRKMIEEEMSILTPEELDQLYELTSKIEQTFKDDPID